MNIDHRAYGLHSGFPPCCVEFWMNEWRHLEKDVMEERFIQQQELEKEIGRYISYIPCPACFESRNFVEVHSCDYDCIEFLVGIGVPHKNVIMSILDNLLMGRICTPKGYRIVDVKRIRIAERV